MSRVQQIEADVAELPPKEFLDFARWFDAERNRKWDQQIEADAKNGKLRKLYELLEAENAGQPEMPLNEVLDDPELSRPT